MSKLNLNFNFSWLDVIKHTLRILVSIGVILLFNRYFPIDLLPKDFMFMTIVYACIYVLVSLIIEVFFKKFESDNHNKRR